MNTFDHSKFKVILVFQSSKRQVLLPKTISYVQLVKYVEQKFDIVFNKNYNFQYKLGSELFHVKDEDGVNYFVLEVCCKSQTVEKLTIKETKESKEVRVLQPPIHDFDLNVSLFQQQSNEEPSKYPKCMLNLFTNMPKPPSQPEPNIKTSRVNCHGIKIGDDYATKIDCIYYIGLKSLRENFQYRVVKSCPVRYGVKCLQPGCKWEVFARKVKVGIRFAVTNCNDLHTCSKTQINPNHRNATMKLLGMILVDKMKCTNRIYKVKDIQHDMNVDWKVDISYKRAWGGRNIALNLMNGSHEDSFGHLPFYCHNLKLANEGTVTHIQTDDEGRFEMLYVGFGFAMRSFLRYMRPLIIIDGAHLKGNYKGTNLLAVGMDRNNQIVPLATGVSQGETGESWTWFLNKLKEQIGEPPNLCIISDRHPAIILACSTVFENSFHGFCDRHLLMNCNLKGKKHRGLFWKACKAYTRENFDKTIAELRSHRAEAVSKLESAGFEKWSRAYCPSSRYNYMTSNSVESINSLTRLVRRVPITMLIEYCRDLLQQWYCEKRHRYAVVPEYDLSDWATAKVYDRMLKSSQWTVKGIDQLHIYQVTTGKEVHQVDLYKFECTCRKWQLFGIPCGHVCAVCRVSDLTNCHLWAKPWFTKTTLKKTYTEFVYPLKDPSLWENPADLQVVLPPRMTKRPAGRPRNKDRIPSRNEAPTLASCTGCGMNGHNRNGCNQPLPSQNVNYKRSNAEISQQPMLDEERYKNGGGLDRQFYDFFSQTDGNLQQSQQWSTERLGSFHLDDL